VLPKAGYQKQVVPAYYLLSKQVSPAFDSQLKKHWSVHPGLGTTALLTCGELMPPVFVITDDQAN
jgi:hypothetical protein